MNYIISNDIHMYLSIFKQLIIESLSLKTQTDVIYTDL